MTGSSTLVRLGLVLSVLSGCGAAPADDGMASGSSSMSADSSETGNEGPDDGLQSSDAETTADSSGDDTADDTGEVSGGLDAGSTSDGSSSTGEVEPDPEGYVIYLNFDGVEVVQGANDSRLDELPFEDLVGIYPPMDDAVYRAEFTALLESYYADFDIRFTDERPPAGDYTMIVVSPRVVIEGVIGLATAVDCDDANRNEIILVSTMIADAPLAARVGARVLGAGLGLDGVYSDVDVMGEGAMGDKSFVDACNDLRAPQCGSTHQDFCPQGEENTYAELMDLLGPAVLR